MKRFPLIILCLGLFSVLLFVQWKPLLNEQGPTGPLLDDESAFQTPLLPRGKSKERLLTVSRQLLSLEVNDPDAESDKLEATQEESQIISAFANGRRHEARETLRNWLHRDIKTALIWISQNPQLKDTSLLVELVNSSIGEHFEAKEALKYIQLLEPFIEVHQRISELQFQKWLNNSPSEARDWLTQRHQQQETHSALTLFTESLAQYDYLNHGGQRTANLAARFSNQPSLKESYLQTLYQTWAKHSPNEFGEWIQEAPSSRNKDLGILAYIEEIKTFDSGVAMTWVEFIEHPDIQSYALSQIDQEQVSF